MSKFYFCTLFDHRYLPRGLVLYKTLKQHCPNAVLHILCLSEKCYEILTELALPDAVLTKLADLESFDTELLSKKNSRSWVEYIFTLSPCWPLYLLKSYPNIDILTQVDADTAFFSDPRPALQQHMATTSVGITGHCFPKKLKRLEKFGLYNVGFQTFRRNDIGFACLLWWRERCLEWCGDYIDGERYADQKYLNKWPDLFAAKQFSHYGLNIAPWNVDSFKISTNGNKILVNNDPLVFFHFQGIEQVIGKWWDVGLIKNHNHMTTILRDEIFSPYLNMLLTKNHEVSLIHTYSAQRSRLNYSKFFLSRALKLLNFIFNRKRLIKISVI